MTDHAKVDTDCAGVNQLLCRIGVRDRAAIENHRGSISVGMATEFLHAYAKNGGVNPLGTGDASPKVWAGDANDFVPQKRHELEYK